MSVDFKQLQSIVYKDWESAFDTREKCVEHGWYDWFCPTSSLKSRTRKFFPLITGIREGGKVDFGWGACFKNNMPLADVPLYDDIRLSSERGNELVITRGDRRERRLWVVYGPENGYKSPLFEAVNVSQLVHWLNEPWAEGEPASAAA